MRKLLENVKSEIFWLHFYMNTNILNNIPSISPESTCVTATVPDCPGHSAPPSSSPKCSWSSKQLRAHMKTWLCRWPFRGELWRSHKPGACSKWETFNHQKNEYLHCELLLIFKDFQYTKAFSKTPRTVTVQQIAATWQATKRNYRQKASNILAPYTLAKSSQNEMGCSPRHKTRLNNQSDEKCLSPVQPIPDIKWWSILASETFRIPVLRTSRHTNTQMKARHGNTAITPHGKSCTKVPEFA